MAHINDCPYGFEDGHIVAYTADGDRLSVDYEFWNERRGIFTFGGFQAVNDHVALGATIGAVKELHDSPLIQLVLKFLYETPPDEPGLMAYVFVGVDGDVVFEIVAADCQFCERGQADGRSESDAIG